jgi:quercetin dioxygenase-like cupin family protein
VPDDIISVGREQIAVRLTTAETGGTLLALDVTMPPGGGPPGLHRHAAAEAYRVLEGELTLYLGDERIPAPAGSVFHVPGGRAHTIRNESDAPARGTRCFALPSSQARTSGRRYISATPSRWSGSCARRALPTT